MLPWLETTDLNLYLWHEEAGEAVLFRDAETPIDPWRAAELAENPDARIYLRTRELERYCKAAVASLETVVGDETLSPEGRFEIVQSIVRYEIERTLRVLNPEQYIDLVGRVGSQIRALVTDGRVLPSALFAIARHDSETFSHVTNVAGYAVLLAEQLGIGAAAELDEIAAGAMLHDIGKRFVSQRILTKPARLTPEEQEVVRLHPTKGYCDLVDHESVTSAQLMMVYQHHERVDGTGYPVQVLADEIHPWAKLLAVVDVFDALTGRRPYRRPMSAVDALNFITHRSGTHFDEEMTACWKSTIRLS